MNKHQENLYKALKVEALARHLVEDEHPWADTICEQTQTLLTQLNHGDLAGWLKQLEQKPSIATSSRKLDRKAITLRSAESLDNTNQHKLNTCLQGLKPWRKGPFSFFGIEIDSEWRSDLKWSRIDDKLDLEDKTVLDVGCANGYFGWRMLDAGAKKVVGIDPGLLFIIQFLLTRYYVRHTQTEVDHWVLPYRLEDLPSNLNYFDTAFSMGVLYHRRSVFDHLFELKQCLKPGGQLVLETLVIAPDQGEVLVPKDRYARMRNVWFIPNTEILSAWLERSGFIDIQIIDEENTSLVEQRKTKWIDSQSLDLYLDPTNQSKTIEGYPAPRRAILFARKPGLR